MIDGSFIWIFILKGGNYTNKNFKSENIGHIKILLCVVALFIIVHFVIGFQISIVSGSSMASTINDGDIVCSVAVHNPLSLKRGDIITLYPNEDTSIAYIKRIIGLPGETIEARDNAIYIDGCETDFAFGTGSWGPIVIPDDAVFVLGDNRAISLDSRAFGPIPTDQIISKVFSINCVFS